MYLVTGCAGFIGSNLCHYLKGKEQVIGIDALVEGSNLANLDGADIIFEQADVRSSRTMEEIFDRYAFTHVIHLAAMSHVDRSLTGDKIFWETNVLGTRNIMEQALAYQVKVVNQITDEVYGAILEGEAFEGDKFYPTSPYPCSKVGQYWVGKSYYTTFGLPVVSTFPVNNYGPRQHPEKLIPCFITKLLKGKKVPLMVSTHFERDWLPVKDMAKALYLLSKEGVAGEDYNIGADRHHTNRMITDKLLELCGRDESYIEIVPDRVAHDARYAVNSDKIKALGFRLDHDFDEYLKETVDWYREETRCANSSK